MSPICATLPLILLNATGSDTIEKMVKYQANLPIIGIT